jgi:hypothetical protein
MPLTISVAPTRLANFAVKYGTAPPVARMPVYTEIVVRSEWKEPAVDIDGRPDDAILLALRHDAPGNIVEPQPGQRLADVIGQEIARQPGPNADSMLRVGDPAEFIASACAPGASAEHPVPGPITWLPVNTSYYLEGYCYGRRTEGY